MARKKTREEKIKSSYRLQNFSLQVNEIQNRKDVQEFGYLSKEYVRKDLSKTLVFSALIVALLLIVRKYLG